MSVISDQESKQRSTHWFSQMRAELQKMSGDTRSQEQVEEGHDGSPPDDNVKRGNPPDDVRAKYTAVARALGFRGDALDTDKVYAAFKALHDEVVRPRVDESAVSRGRQLFK